MNWTNITDNPVEPKVHSLILKHLIGMRKVVNTSSKEWRINNIKGKRVLDIGMAEHDISHIDSPNWKHNYIRESASYCLGLDIIESLVDELNNRGYNVVHMDATSNEYLGEKFDVVNIGDVIEHVNDPIKLLEFAKRHLNDHGKILVSTPNPFFYKYIIRTFKESTFIANFENNFWITPSMALEIGRRSGIKLSGYYMLCSKNNLKSKIQKKISRTAYI
jgi:2-polyprenyl-3-methyl-5-hydroxy-6-metoxy-1,4-benzoquinol methylase